MFENNKNTKLTSDLEVKEITKKNKRIISVIDGKKEIILSEQKTTPYFWNKWVYDQNYIVSYTRGNTINNIPLTIEGAYNREKHSQVLLQEPERKKILEYMLIFKKRFSLAQVLEEINKEELDILLEKEKGVLENYVTAGNPSISKEMIENYILQEYPKLKDYRDLPHNLSVKDYRNIEEQHPSDFWLHIISQDIDNLSSIPKEITNLKENDARQIYNAEYHHQQKVLQLKR